MHAARGRRGGPGAGSLSEHGARENAVPSWAGWAAGQEWAAPGTECTRPASCKVQANERQAGGKATARQHQECRGCRCSPEPEGPTSAVMDPGSISTWTPSTAVKIPRLVSKRFTMPRTEICAPCNRRCCCCSSPGVCCPAAAAAASAAAGAAAPFCESGQRVGCSVGQLGADRGRC